jgi:hypothetical protein
MTRGVGGVLDQEALARMHFNALNHEDQLEAIVRLAEAGQTDQAIARATALSVEQIRTLVADSSSGKWVTGRWFPDWRLRELAENHGSRTSEDDA